MEEELRNAKEKLVNVHDPLVRFMYVYANAAPDGTSLGISQDVETILLTEIWMQAVAYAKREGFIKVSSNECDI